MESVKLPTTEEFLQYSKPDEAGQFEQSILVDGEFQVLMQAQKHETPTGIPYIHLLVRSSFAHEGAEWNVQ
eukprot:9235454-Karenia_brevis.AAC.1